MDRTRRELMFVSAAAFRTGIASHHAFNGLFDSSLGYIHPRCTDVAVAVREAVADGVLGEQALATGVSDAGFWRATEQLHEFERRDFGPQR